MAGYPGQYGNVLVRKETLDKSLNTIIGAPVIINHLNVTADNANDLRVGVISNAYYNDKDGWYWCEGVIWDETAQNLITDKKWSVSCSYDFLEQDDEGGTENNIPYDREFTKLNFVHLALVDNPRYERANIVFNSKTVIKNDSDFESKHPRKKDGTFTKTNGQSFYNESTKTIELNRFYNLNNKTYTAENSSRGERAIGVADEEFSINIITDSKEDFNSMIKNNEVQNWNEADHPRDEAGKFINGSNGVNPNYKEELKQVIGKAKNNPNERQKLVIGKVSKDLEEKAKENGFDITDYEHNLDVSGTRHAFKTHGNGKKEDSRGQIAITDEDFEKIPDIVYTPDNISFGETDAKDTPLIKYSKRFDDGTVIYVEEIRTRQKTLTIKSMWKQKNNADNSCTFTDFNPQRPEYISNIIITDNRENFNPNMKNNVQNNKEQDMALLEELKKLISTVENSKGEEKMDDKDKEVDNEKVDKRKLIDEVGGILKGKVDEEVWRTVIGKLEKLSYNKSEAGTADNGNDDKEDEKADNKKVKNNETKEDEKKDEELKKNVKEDVENKCKNSVDNSKGGFFDKINEIYNSAMKPKEENIYVSRADKLKAAEEYFS